MAVQIVEYRYQVGAQAERLRDEVRPRHRDFLRTLLDAGSLLASGPLVETPGAMLLLVAPDAEAATALLAEDPFLTEGVVAEVGVRGWKPVIGPFADRI
ncbi:YciI family protein [Serinibacter salmoneus]|uniref:YCII-related domain-containing protein n=1 Tax=Serinibacter salmoneus TaxID=556530 RepID=A0A2A9CZA4_9MICO|nr:YciI family protein [Serinibacter salmoneus]PFG19733.1 hypothetical protein ATL40_1302 [Serinibacter salmoneus]